MRKGWFRIPGKQEGDRTLQEQMLGIGPALAEAKDCTVADYGCAEGLIAVEFVKAGAKAVYACDFNPRLIRVAKRVVGTKVQLEQVDLRHRIGRDNSHGQVQRFDIVLALAIIHKMHSPELAARFFAGAAGRLLVVRLPRGSTGVVQSKYGASTCDLNALMPSLGFRLERMLPGPCDEFVQYWRRC